MSQRVAAPIASDLTGVGRLQWADFAASAPVGAATNM